MIDESKKIKTRILQTHNIYNLFKKLEKDGYKIVICKENIHDKDLKTAYIYTKDTAGLYKNNYFVKVDYKEKENEERYFTPYEQSIYQICY